jgi:hypothetical protein
LATKEVGILKKGVAFLLILLMAASLILIFNLPSGNAINPPVTQWNLTYTGFYAGAITQTNDGGYMLAMTNTTGHFPDLIKTDANGNKVWMREYNYPYSSGPVTDVIQTSDGGYAFCGVTGIGRYYQVYMYKVDANGNSVYNWTKTAGYMNISPMIVEENGAIVIAGSEGVVNNGVIASDIWLTKTGDSSWTATYGNISYFASLVKTSDGSFVIGGYDFKDTAGAPSIPIILKIDSEGKT